MKLRYVFWGAAVIALVWNLIEFSHNVAEAAHSTTGFPTYFTAWNGLVYGILSSFTYFFYGELIHLIGKLINQKKEQ